MLCGHLLEQIPKHIHYPKENSVLIHQFLPIPHFPGPLVTTNLFSVPTDVPMMDISYERNRSYVAFYAWLLSLSVMFSTFIRVVNL